MQGFFVVLVVDTNQGWVLKITLLKRKKCVLLIPCIHFFFLSIILSTVYMEYIGRMSDASISDYDALNV